jgi:hypothetical protein
MTNNGSVIVSQGVKGNFSASFNGTNQSLTTLSGVNLNNKSFSISFWSYLTKTIGDRYVLNIGSVNATRQFLTIGYKTAHTFSFCFFSDDLDTDKLYAYEDLNQWIHYTCTYNVINNQRIIYRNGLLVKVGNSGGSLNTTNILTLGYFSGFPAYYGGGVDDLRIYSGLVLSGTQVSELYNGRVTLYTMNNTIYNTLTSNRMSYLVSNPLYCSFNYGATLYTIKNNIYEFIFNTGSISINVARPISITDKSYPILKDISNNTNYNINPSAWYTFDDPTNIGLDSMGMYSMTNTGSVNVLTGLKGDCCASFNGSTQYLSTTTGVNINNKSFSISFWSKTNSNGVYNFIYGTTGTNYATRTKLCIGYRNTNVFTFSFYGDDLDAATYASDVGIWIHWTCTYNVSNNQRIIYRNGVSVATGTSGGALNGDNTYGIAGILQTLYFNGTIDDLRIYGGIVLTATQILELYTGRLSFLNINIPSTSIANNANNALVSGGFSQGGITSNFFNDIAGCGGDGTGGGGGGASFAGGIGGYGGSGMIIIRNLLNNSIVNSNAVITTKPKNTGHPIAVHNNNLLFATNISNTFNYYYMFSTPNVVHSINFPSDTICDILMVGGGGSGGNGASGYQGGGGGGGGTVIYKKDAFVPAGNYNIIVGDGGHHNNNGTNTQAFGATAYGGSGGNNRRPWGIYSAENFNGTTLFDMSGYNRHATRTGNAVVKGFNSGNGAAANIHFITGDTGSVITWPAFSVPHTFTICSITRYTGTTNARIFNSPGSNWLHGHWGGARGVAHYNGWKTTSANAANLTNWLVFCGKNEDRLINKDKNCMADGVFVGTETGGVGNITLTINTSEPSTFSFSYVVIWDRHLTDVEMEYMSLGMMNYLATGTSIQTYIDNIVNENYIIPNFLRPWGIYNAANYDASTNLLLDSSGFNRHATTSIPSTITKTTGSGFGAVVSIPYISGGTNANITWPTGSLPIKFTLCSITRYTNPSVNQSRILQASGNNFIHGHYGGNRGVAHYNTWITPNTNLGLKTDWLVCCGKNEIRANYYGNNIISDGYTYGNTGGGTGNGILTLNTGDQSLELSEWGLSYVIIWDRHLSDQQLKYVSNIMTNYLNTGMSIETAINDMININNFGGGGSGGGGTSDFSEVNTVGQPGRQSIKNSILNSTIMSNASVYSNAGGTSGIRKYTGGYDTAGGGGGGGAGQPGISGDGDFSTTSRNIIKGGGDGGDGIMIPILDRTLYWGAGGGGSCYTGIAGNGGFGGGGGGSFLGSTTNGLGGLLGLNNGLTATTNNGGNGGENTGSGGGGGIYGGKGGSGIVIIRYHMPKPSASLIRDIYGSSTYSSIYNTLSRGSSIPYSLSIRNIINQTPIKLNGLTCKIYNTDSRYDSLKLLNYINISLINDFTNISTMTGNVETTNSIFYTAEYFGYFLAQTSGTYTFTVNPDNNNFVNGLKYKSYSGEYYADNVYYTAMKDNSNNYVYSGISTNFTNLNTATNNYYKKDTADYFTVEWTGYFKASVTGTYTFGFYSDNMTSLWIGDNAKMNYTTANALLRANIGSGTATIYLVANTYYPIRILFGEEIGGNDINLYFQLPNSTIQNYDGTGYYFHCNNNTTVWFDSNALNYTSSNYMICTPINSSNSVTLIANTYYPIRIISDKSYGINNMSISLTLPNNKTITDLTGYVFSGTGTNINFPNENAKIIKDITNTNTDGTYYILCNGTSTPTFCLMNDKYDGGGWMMIMKANTEAVFTYYANYWTTANTLNSLDLTRNNANAKYDVFNYIPIKDVMTIWPYNDIGYIGGSLTINDGWTWQVNNWYNSGTKITALDGFQNSRNAQPSNPYSFPGYNPTVWSTQGGAYRHIFGGNSFLSSAVYTNVRWGFIWNNEGEFNSCDVVGGIGLYCIPGFGAIAQRSGGDLIGCCQAATGFNRAMRYELFGR